ncbi:hypothetical protein OAK81_02580 [Verrucomicrobiales bacterium]|nr:hypothetical protein [Verrucomicrobiales bacterium]MDC0322127.1 hypothetical protein [Verrucomicrobiales bacterium]
MISRFFILILLGNHAFSQEVEFPILVRSFAEVKNPMGTFTEGKFNPKNGETISFLGGTNTFDQQRANALEISFYLAWPERELETRNLAWQGDTLFKQARPRYFYTKVGDTQPGSSPDIRERTTPGIIILNFGKMESLSGIEALPDFVAEYKTLLDLLEQKTRRLVLIGPTPFFETGPAAALADSRNAVLEKYVIEIQKLAEERELIFVDAFAFPKSPPGKQFSTNGVHLTDVGQAAFADRVAAELKFPQLRKLDASSPINQAVQRKNRLWQQFYHPTNWAFLFGDRQHVPASRDHIDTAKRWFVDEVQALPNLIAETEADIHRYTREVAQ